MHQLIFHHGPHHQSSPFRDKRGIALCCTLNWSLPHRGFSIEVGVLWLADKCSVYFMLCCRKMRFSVLFSLPYEFILSYVGSDVGVVFFWHWGMSATWKGVGYGVHWLFLVLYVPQHYAQISPCFGLSARELCQCLTVLAWDFSGVAPASAALAYKDKHGCILRMRLGC